MSAFSPGELAGMRRAQEGHMMHVALFQPWRPAQDAASGQMVNVPVTEMTTVCGVNFSAKGAEVETTEGVFVAHYQIRLPLSMAAKARPLSRYVIIESFGELTQEPLTLEQVSEPANGPSGVVVWARNVPMRRGDGS